MKLHRRFTHSARAVLLVTASILSGPPDSLTAQDRPVGSFGETVEVERINIEVRVADKSGQPVTGLTAADFEVLHDGQAVPITNFAEIRGGFSTGVSVAEAGGQEAGGPRIAHHLVVYFDELHLQANHRGVLTDALQGFISDQEIPADKIMILRQGGELHIEASFGSSQEELDRVLASLRKAPPGLSHENSMQTALDEIQRSWNQARDATGSAQTGISQIPGDTIGGGGGSGAAGGTSLRSATSSSGGSLSSGIVPSTCNVFKSRVEAILNGWMQERSSQITTTLASLADSVTYLAALPGTKSLLYLSDALETRPGAALSNYADTICPGGPQNLALNTLGEELGSVFIALSRHAAANRVTIYSVQGGGLQASATGSARDSGVRAGSIASFEATRRADDQSGLLTLADETGGRAVLNQNDYLAALEDLGTDMLNFYSLAYEPPGGSPGTDHRIVVRMRDRNLKARYRRGYIDKSANQRFAESLQGALYLGLVDNPLQARLGAGDFRPGSEGMMVAPLQVILPVEMISFIPEGDQLSGHILIRILSRDLASGLTGSADRPFKIKHDPNSGGEWMQLPVELELMPGSHIVAIGVLDQISGVRSLVSTNLDVPSS